MQEHASIRRHAMIFSASTPQERMDACATISQYLLGNIVGMMRGQNNTRN
jgi:hypothetical protein